MARKPNKMKVEVTRMRYSLIKIELNLLNSRRFLTKMNNARTLLPIVILKINYQTENLLY
jgi:hypothetical protein